MGMQIKSRTDVFYGVSQVAFFSDRPFSRIGFFRISCQLILLPTYREPIVLYYFEQMSVNGICTIMDREPNAVEARLSRARRMLCGILNQRLERERR